MKSFVLQLFLVLRGYVTFRRTGQTPDSAYASIRGLYCLTHGHFNQMVQTFFRLGHRPYSMGRVRGVLGDMGTTDVATSLEPLRTRGYSVFGPKLAEDRCQDLLSFALRTPSLPCGQGVEPVPTVFDAAAARASKYEFQPAQLLQNPTVQELVGDPTLLALAQAYLGCQPVIDIVAMWWSTSALPKPSSAAGQLYHFDMDRIAFLKFFFYVTDVTERTGPHCYVAGSHRRKPKALWHDGRIEDADLLPHFSPADVVEIAGPRGTVFAADTSGFHKGKALESGERLMFQIQFSTDLFGYNYAPIPLPANVVAPLREAMELFPYTYSLFRP